MKYLGSTLGCKGIGVRKSNSISFLIPIILQPDGVNLWYNWTHSLQYQRFTTLGYKDIKNKFELWYDVK